MSEELKIIANDDGTFSEYDDTFDITIHCQSEEEQNEMMEKLNAPQQKMGRWNFTKHYGRDYYVCSFCGMERMDDHSSGWNYCPTCGARNERSAEE